MGKIPPSPRFAPPDRAQGAMNAAAVARCLCSRTREHIGARSSRSFPHRIVLDRLNKRALTLVSWPRARAEQRLKRFLHRMQARDLRVELGNLLGRKLLHRVAALRATGSKPQQGLHLGESETEFLGALYETNDADGIGGVLAVPRVTPRGRLQETPSLVIPQGLDVDSGLVGNLTGSHEA